MEYIEFLKTKITLAAESGFCVAKEDISDALNPHARDAVQWAATGGRRALFEDFGLQKTIQQLELGHLVYDRQEGKAGRPFLQLVPLGVRQEFVRDQVERLHRPAPQYITTMAEAQAAMATGAEIVLDERGARARRRH